jgi:hypothetical protein
VPPSGVAVDEGVAGLGEQAKDKKRRKLRTTDQVRGAESLLRIESSGADTLTMTTRRRLNSVMQS